VEGEDDGAEDEGVRLKGVFPSKEGAGNPIALALKAAAVWLAVGLTAKTAPF